MSDIFLSAPTRSGLQGVQKASQQVELAARRLATGLRVQSVMDDPLSFFHSSHLRDRALSLSQTKDTIGQAFSTMDATFSGMNAMDKFLSGARAMVGQLSNAPDANSYQQSLKNIQMMVNQYDQVAADSGYNGVNLLTSPVQRFDVPLGNRVDNRLSIKGVDLLSHPLGDSGNSGDPSPIQKAMNHLGSLDFASAKQSGTLSKELHTVQGLFSSAQEKLRGTRQSFANTASTLAIRMDYTQAQQQIHDVGAAKLAGADLSEEMANLLTAQTRQKLGLKTFAIAGKMEDTILQLLR